jgi:hypothetical protein
MAEQRKNCRRGSQLKAFPSDNDVVVLDSIQEHSQHHEIQTDFLLDNVKGIQQNEVTTTSDVTPVSESPILLSTNVSRRPSTTSITSNNEHTQDSLLQIIPTEHRVVIFKYQWGEYDGEMQGDMMQGKGLYKYDENDTYEGDWKDNRRHGRGVRRWPNGEEYSGEWAKGVKHGKGILKYADGSILYDGDWEFGRKEGKGKMKYPNGDVYVGDWIYGNRNGKGIFTTANGDIYDGHWKEDKKHGSGILDCSNGR